MRKSSLFLTVLCASCLALPALQASTPAPKDPPAVAQAKKAVAKDEKVLATATKGGDKSTIAAAQKKLDADKKTLADAEAAAAKNAGTATKAS